MVAQALNITSSQAPGSTSVGGIMPMKSLAQVQAEARAQAQAANNEPVVQGFASHIRKLWWQARQAKEMTAEQKMLKSVRQRRGEYDPEKLAQLAEQGSTVIYMMITSNKCRAAASWLRDVLITTTEDKPWTLKAPPVADMPPDLTSEIMQMAQQQLEQMMMAGQNPSDMEVRQMLMALKDMGMAQLQDMADADAERMERKMQTQLIEGGWLRAFTEFIDDITTFPSAIMKGPVVRKRPKLKWVPGPGGFVPDVQDQLVMEWERVDPFNAYPAPDASNIEDGWFIERHKLQRADLVALLGVEGYSDAAIRAVLDQYGKGGLRDWIYVDTAKATAEGKATIGVAMNPSELIDALQFWGSVQGQMLIDWGMDESEIPDPLLEYPIEAWLIGPWVIKAVLNPDPLGRKPYYKASYEEVPGAFWGNSVADLCRDTQDVCNAAARALVNNMGIASGPQVVYNVDRLPDGEKITQMYPWKIWQVVSDPLSSNQPPMQFFQPQSQAQELMMVYNQFSQLADEYTGIPRYMTGDSPTGGAGRTASGMSMLMSNAGKSIKQVIGNVDDRVTEPAVDRLYYYNMRYGTDPDLKGAVNVVARGASSLMQKEAAQQRQQEFLQAALGNQIVQQVVGQEGIAELLRNAAKNLDMDADKIVAPLPILQQRWQQQQKQQAAQAAQMNAQQFAQQLLIKQGVLPPGMAQLVPAEIQAIMHAPPTPPMPGAPALPPPGPQGAPGPQSGPGPQLPNGAPATAMFAGQHG